MVEMEVIRKDQVEVKAKVVLWFVTMVEFVRSRCMRIDWDSKMRNLYMAYAEAVAYTEGGAHALDRYTVLAVVAG